MFAVVETALFQQQWPAYRKEEERGDFVAELAASPTVGVLIKESGGIRKLRWKRWGPGRLAG